MIIFYSIFTGNQSYFLNKKQVYFVSKIYDDFLRISRKNRFISLNNLNNKFNLTKKRFLKDQKIIFHTKFY